MRLVPKKREILILPFLTGSSVQETGGPDFFVSWESASYDTKTLLGDRTAAERNHVAEATRRRRRILRSRILFYIIGKCVL